MVSFYFVVVFLFVCLFFAPVPAVPAAAAGGSGGLCGCLMADSAPLSAAVAVAGGAGHVWGSWK